MPLLARTTRGMSLTEAGADFRPYAERMVAELQSARDALSRQGEATGRLRLTAPLSFGALAPRAGAGRARVAQPEPRDQHLLQRPGGRPGRRGVRRGGAARQPVGLEPDRAADRAGPRAAGGEPRLPGAGRDAAHAGRPRRARGGAARRPGLAVPPRRQGLHPPAARAVHRRQRPGRARRGGGRARHRGDAGVPRRPGDRARRARHAARRLRDPGGGDVRGAAAAGGAAADEGQGADRHPDREVRQGRLGRLPAVG